jgi:hypothetical protein
MRNELTVERKQPDQSSQFKQESYPLEADPFKIEDIEGVDQHAVNFNTGIPGFSVILGILGSLWRRS